MNEWLLIITFVLYPLIRNVLVPKQLISSLVRQDELSTANKAIPSSVEAI